MSRLARFVVCLACLVAFSSRSSAAVVIDIKEVGGNVVASTTGGTLNVNGFSSGFMGSNPGGLIGPSFLLLGSGAWNQYDGQMTISAPYSQASFAVPASSSTGPLVGFLLSGGSNGSLYISNTAAVSGGVVTIAGVLLAASALRRRSKRVAVG